MREEINTHVGHRVVISMLLWAIVNMRQQFTDSLAYLTHPDRLNFVPWQSINGKLGCHMS